MVHIPVLLHEVVDSLNLSDGKIAVDGTMNGGGHARAIIPKIMPTGQYIGIELDKDICQETADNLKSEFPKNSGQIIIHQGNYRDIKSILQEHKIKSIDAVLLDLGFSSIQLEESGRGFSFQNDEVLDMRYDIKEPITAAHILNSMQEKALADLIWRFGEERFSRLIAKAIVLERKKNRIMTTSQLNRVISSAVPAFYRKGRINPSTKTFQALRIYVNQELANLEKFLTDIPELMSEKGRVAIISFHSLEDRIVKQAFNKLAKEKNARLISKKPIIATRQEIQDNPRSRSAKLRVVEII